MKNVFSLGDSKFHSGADGLKTSNDPSQIVLLFPANLTETVECTPLRISDRLLGLRAQNTMNVFVAIAFVAVKTLK